MSPPRKELGVRVLVFKSVSFAGIAKVALVTVACALVLTGCADKPAAQQAPSAPSDIAATPSPTATPEETSTTFDNPRASGELGGIVQAYSDAFLTGDAATTRALLSHRCQGKVSTAEWKRVVAQAAHDYGKPHEFKTLDIRSSGDRARVSYTYRAAGAPRNHQRWVWEHHGWHEDDC